MTCPTGMLYVSTLVRDYIVVFPNELPHWDAICEHLHQRLYCSVPTNHCIFWLCYRACISGVTGRGRNRGHSAPQTFFTGKFLLTNGDKRLGKKGKWRRKEEKIGRKGVICILLFTFWNHWNLFGVYQNGNFYWEKEHFAPEKMTLPLLKNNPLMPLACMRNSGAEGAPLMPLACMRNSGAEGARAPTLFCSNYCFLKWEKWKNVKRKFKTKNKNKKNDTKGMKGKERVRMIKIP